MKKIGITGQTGFIGSYLFNTLFLHREKFTLIPFQDAYFDSTEKLENFVKQCDVIVHLAAMNRHGDPQVIYNTNIKLVKKLIAALEKTGSKAHIIFSSSTQEERDNLYGRSKKEGRRLFIDWAKNNRAPFTGMLIPNVYGPFGTPFYNSVIATFSYQLTHADSPKIEVDGNLKLIYVGELISEIVKILESNQTANEYHVTHTAEVKVSEILRILEHFKNDYFLNGEIPFFKNSFELNLFNTFRCYIETNNHFPVKYIQHADERGKFVETIKLNTGGQVSFSTTKPGITRGNHFHTRKIERFAVISGKAKIQLRRFGTTEILNFYLNGDEPAYVDMPIWYTHNITNIGNDELYTIFWINEFYDPNDSDTFFETI